MYILQTWKNHKTEYRISSMSYKERLIFTSKRFEMASEMMTEFKKHFSRSPIFYSAEKAKLACLTQSEDEPIYLNFRDYIFPEEK